jgi:Family of unknown function (DUF6328)
MKRASPNQEPSEDLPLSKAAQYLLQEARMVLPGIQALFGFQLIAVFNSTFSEKLSSFDQRLHLAAIGLLAIAIALIMAPAAYHRHRGAQRVTLRFIQLSTRLLLASMLPLAVSICIDFYLVGGIIIGKRVMPWLALGMLGVFAILWFALPRVRFLQRLVTRGSDQESKGV